MASPASHLLIEQFNFVPRLDWEYFSTNQGCVPCRAGFVVVDLVMMFLVAAFSISTMINLFCALFALPRSNKPTNIWACRAFLLFDCITCGIMLMSKCPEALYLFAVYTDLEPSERDEECDVSCVLVKCLQEGKRLVS